MGGNSKTPEDWRGGLPDLQYNLGPDFLPKYQGFKLRLSTHNTNKVFRNYNVIATMRGEVEPGEQSEESETC